MTGQPGVFELVHRPGAGAEPRARHSVLFSWDALVRSLQGGTILGVVASADGVCTIHFCSWVAASLAVVWLARPAGRVAHCARLVWRRSSRRRLRAATAPRLWRQHMHFPRRRARKSIGPLPREARHWEMRVPEPKESKDSRSGESGQRTSHRGRQRRFWDHHVDEYWPTVANIASSLGIGMLPGCPGAGQPFSSVAVQAKDGRGSPWAGS